MRNFDFYSPTYFVFGKDREAETGRYVKRFGGSRVLVVYGGQSAIMFRLQAQQGQGHANMVIEISLCIEHIEFFFQYGRNQFLRCGFPVGNTCKNGNK